MANKMDGVKISANQPSGGKKPAKGPAGAAKRSTSPANKKPAKTMEKSSKKGLFIVLAVVVSALVFGGGTYLWKDSEYDESIDRISKNAQSTRLEFEQRIDNLKNKILGLEKSKKELESENTKLKERVALLNSAKLEFFDSELGLSFEYPALFGEVKVTIHEGATGTSFMGEWTENEKLKFGGLSRDYEGDSTSTAVDILDTLGYYEDRDEYFFQPYGGGENRDFELQPAKIIQAENTEVLLLDKKSFVNQDGFSPASGDRYVDIGENVAGLANLQTSVYGGVAFVNMDFGMMPLENFENMLKSVEVR